MYRKKASLLSRVRVRVRARDGESIFPFFFLLKVTNTFVLPSWPRLGLVQRVCVCM